MSGAPSFGGLQRLLNNAAFQKMKFKGSTSGTATVQAAAVAGTPTISLPAVTGTLATLAGTETLTNKTLTAPTITSPTVSGAVWSGSISRCSSAQTANTNTTYASITGLSTTVVAGTYRFRCVLPSTVGNATGGIKYAFHYTTTALTSIEASAVGNTASATATQHTTTTTDASDLFNQAAVVILTEIEGTMVVATGGTIALQMAQSGSNASNSVALVGGTMEFVQIA